MGKKKNKIDSFDKKLNKYNKKLKAHLQCINDAKSKFNNNESGKGQELIKTAVSGIEVLSDDNAKMKEIIESSKNIDSDIWESRLEGTLPDTLFTFVDRRKKQSELTDLVDGYLGSCAKKEGESDNNYLNRVIANARKFEEDLPAYLGIRNK